jgi:hypothetical protein
VSHIDPLVARELNAIVSLTNSIFRARTAQNDCTLSRTVNELRITVAHLEYLSSGPERPYNCIVDPTFSAAVAKMSEYGDRAASYLQYDDRNGDNLQSCESAIRMVRQQARHLISRAAALPDVTGNHFYGLADSSVRPGKTATRTSMALLAVAARFLPPEDRDLFAREWTAQLAFETPVRQLRCTLSLLFAVNQIRRAALHRLGPVRGAE